MRGNVYFEEMTGEPWSHQKRLHWYFNQAAKGRVRDYQSDIVARLKKLPEKYFSLEHYGRLTIDGPRYPLLSVTKGDLTNGKPNILITAGVHGYEPSGWDAALTFLENDIHQYKSQVNFLVYPCISPWAYEYDHRWNAFAEDPNRCFSFEKPWVDECRWFMDSIVNLDMKFDAAIDLHETPDRDIELRKGRASRYGTELEEYWQTVPQGSYVMLSEAGAARKVFGEAVVSAMKQISPIAPEDKILGKENHGGMTLSSPVSGTMRAFLNPYATHVAITEVYPDHATMTPHKAIMTQLAAIRGAISFVRR